MTLMEEDGVIVVMIFSFMRINDTTARYREIHALGRMYIQMDPSAIHRNAACIWFYYAHSHYKLRLRPC